MRLGNPFDGLIIGEIFETVLPDFILAFAFFTAVVYAILGKRFGQQRPAIAMSASIGFALSVGLVWWEHANGFSIKDLGPIAIGFAVIILALVMYNSIRQVGGSWAGAGIALGASIIVAKLLQIGIPIDPEIIRTTMTVALITGIIAFLLHRHRIPHIHYPKADLADIRHDMSDLYRDKHISKKLTKGLKQIRHESKDLNERPEEARNVMRQLKRILPAEGWLTEQMAQLREKAHRIRNGHVARLEETRQIFTKLPTSAKKRAAEDLAARYKQLIGIDSRLERLDKTVAENERRIRDLTVRARQYTASYDSRNLHDCLKAAQKLQHHNTRLIKIIKRTEGKLSAIAKETAKQVREVDKQ
jgi:hypothetical protein